MDNDGEFTHSIAAQSKEEMDMRKGPWTSEEDSKLITLISVHGEGRWDSLARCAGLKRTGKSCRFRWLNYLRPSIRRGNITAEEQILIFELQSRFGNRWSKIAQHLPGRTDNDIKNYWRTRVQKLAKQLKCDVNGNEFKDIIQYIWLPRLMEQAHATSESLTAYSSNIASADGDNNNYQSVLMTASHVLQTGLAPIVTNQKAFDTDLSPSSVLYDFNHDTVTNWSSNFKDELICGARLLHAESLFGCEYLGFDTHTSGDLDDNMAGLIRGYLNNEDFGFLYPELHESSSNEGGYVLVLNK